MACKFRLLVGFVLAVVGLGLAPVVGAAWATQTVDGTADSGFYHSLAFNPVTGFAAIAYSGPTAHNQTSVKFAQWKGVSWEIQTVTSGRSGDTQVSLAFDASGNPSIAYTMSGVQFAHRTGSTWSTQTIDSKGGGTVSLVYQGGQAWVAFAGSTALKLAHQTGSTWTAETVDGSGMSYMSLAFAPDGNPSVAYRSGSNTSTLKFAHKTGSAWAIQDVETCMYCGIFASLAYDPLSGNPSIAHSNGNLTNLRFARWDGFQWSTELAAMGSCSHTSLAYDAAGIAAISYDFTPDTNGYSQLRFAHRTGCGGTCWEDELVEDDAPLHVQWRTSLAFGPTGAAAIGYGVAYPQTLHFAQQTP